MLVNSMLIRARLAYFRLFEIVYPVVCFRAADDSKADLEPEVYACLEGLAADLEPEVNACMEGLAADLEPKDYACLEICSDHVFGHLLFSGFC